MKQYVLPQITSCGYFNCTEEFGNLKRSPERISKGIEIELFLEDGESTFLNGREYRILKNHVIIAKENSRRYSLLPFKTVFLKIKATDELKAVLDALPDYFHATRTDRIKELLDEIILLNEQKNKNALMVGAKVLMLIDILIKDTSRNALENSMYYPSMHRAKKIIEERYAEKISAEDIAKEVNLSESRFRFLFGKTYGITPHQYLTDIRITHAKQMLWGNASMGEIAERCGFGSQQYFNDCFKKETGITPGQYKKDFARRYQD